MARDLPIGIQSFEKMRRDGYVYVDKTAFVHELARTSVPCFLSRPRRFGKSLLVSTLRAYFEGRRDLFEGLAIERLEGDGPGAWTKRPVFHMSFNGPDYKKEGALEAKLEALLARWEARWGVPYEVQNPGDRLLMLLESAHERSGQCCAVLVDEYDKPLLECVDDPGLEERGRAALKAFFGVLKDADEHLRFLLITGVTKFSKVSIFSDLNQLKDITQSAAYAGICGITEHELLANFGPELDAMADEMGTDRDGCLIALRDKYDGYRFHWKGPGVYNPFSLLSALAERELGSYWFETGTPTFLVRRMRDAGLEPKRLTDGSIYAEEDRLSDYRADDPDPIPLLFQAGYLTIRSYDPSTGEYELTVPNGEVEWGLLKSLLPAWAPGYGAARGTDVFTLRRLVEAGDTDGMRRVIEALFASIPYTRESDPFENYFQTVLWLVFTLLGRYVQVEVRQARGRVDCVVEARAHVYVIEFKRGGTAADALAQIEGKDYAAPFSADSRKLHLIGCAFDPKTRLLSDWEEC
jgi:hypothetical protein